MTSYEKYYLTQKPKGFYFSREVCDMFGLSLSKVQRVAQLLNIKKDAAHVYVFDDSDLDRMRQFITFIKPQTSS